MKTQKQSRVDSLEKRMAATTNVLQHMMNELSYIKDLCVGTLETIKQMPDYDEAIRKLKTKFLRNLVRQKRLSPWKRLATRSGYMGSGFLIAAQWTIEPKLYIIGFIMVMVQTASRKQWNLVALNMNGLIAWIKHLTIT